VKIKEAKTMVKGNKVWCVNLFNAIPTNSERIFAKYARMPDNTSNTNKYVLVYIPGMCRNDNNLCAFSPCHVFFTYDEAERFLLDNKIEAARINIEDCEKDLVALHREICKQRRSLRAKKAVLTKLLKEKAARENPESVGAILNEIKSGRAGQCGTKGHPYPNIPTVI